MNNFKKDNKNAKTKNDLIPDGLNGMCRSNTMCGLNAMYRLIFLIVIYMEQLKAIFSRNLLEDWRFVDALSILIDNFDIPT